MPTVSVVIPTFNRAHVVGQAIESVLAQTLTDFELILVDDGSSDNTAEIVKNFVDPRVRYVRQSNAGAGLAETGCGMRRVLTWPHFWIRTTCGCRRS